MGAKMRNRDSKSMSDLMAEYNNAHQQRLDAFFEKLTSK